MKIIRYEFDSEDKTERNNDAGSENIDKHDFSMRILVLLIDILDLDQHEETYEERKEMLNYCDMATEEFNNNNFDIAHQHLSHAEDIHRVLMKKRRDIHSPEFKRNFLERKNVLLFSLFKLEDVETKDTKEIKDKIKSYCDIAFKEFVNNNFHIARHHLTQAGKIHSQFLNRRKDACPTSNGRSNETDEKVDKLLKGNEEVKERCLGIAQEAINNGNLQKADMFLLISQSFPITDIPKLSQTLLDSISSNDSKDANHKKDTPKENSVAESRSRKDDTKATNAALFVNKKPLEVPKPEPVRSDKDRKVNDAASGVSATTQIHENSCPPNKTSTSHMSVPKPLVNVSKNNTRKSAEAATTKKTTAKPDRIQSEARNEKNNSSVNSMNQNQSKKDQNNVSKKEGSEKDKTERNLLKDEDITAEKLLRQVQALKDYNCYVRDKHPEVNCIETKALKAMREEQVTKEKAANEQAEKQKAENEQAEREKAKNEQAAKEKAAREKAAKDRETKQTIERINAATNYRDMLGVGRQATLQEVSTAYHRLTLLLHPDKNRAPGVTEAYMTVTHAYKKLQTELKAAKKKGFS